MAKKEPDGEEKTDQVPVPLPKAPGFMGQVQRYEEVESFFAQAGFKKRSLGAFVLNSEGDFVQGLYGGIERRGPFSSWMMRVRSKDGKQVVGLWVNDIVKDQLEGVTIGTPVGLMFKGWIEGRQFNYRDYDLFVGEVPKQEAPPPDDTSSEEEKAPF